MLRRVAQCFPGRLRSARHAAARRRHRAGSPRVPPGQLPAERGRDRARRRRLAHRGRRDRLDRRARADRLHRGALRDRRSPTRRSCPRTSTRSRASPASSARRPPPRMAPAELTARVSLTPRSTRAATVDEIAERLREVVYEDLRRRGAVVGLSGGIDSSVVRALCAHAFGPERVLGVLMPEARLRRRHARPLRRRRRGGRGRDRARGHHRRSSTRPAATSAATTRSGASSPSTARAGRRRSCSRACSAATATASSRSSPSRRTASAARRG